MQVNDWMPVYGPFDKELGRVRFHGNTAVEYLVYQTSPDWNGDGKVELFERFRAWTTNDDATFWMQLQTNIANVEVRQRDLAFASQNAAAVWKKEATSRLVDVAQTTASMPLRSALKARPIASHFVRRGFEHLLDATTQ